MITGIEPQQTAMIVIFMTVHHALAGVTGHFTGVAAVCFARPAVGAKYRSTESQGSIRPIGAGIIPVIDLSRQAFGAASAIGFCSRLAGTGPVAFRCPGFPGQSSRESQTVVGQTR